MKKKIAIIIPIVIVLLIGISTLFYFMGQNSKGPATFGSAGRISANTSEAEFIKTLEKNLKARTTYSLSKEKEYVQNPETYNEKKFHTELLEKEQTIYEFKTREYENPRLAQLTKDYIAGLEKQAASLDYYEADYMKYLDLWKEGYEKRAVALIALHEEFGLNLPEDAIESFNSISKATLEKEEEEKTIKAMIDKIEFISTETKGDYTTYSAIVENTTGLNFDYMNLTISLLQGDVVVESAHTNIDYWEANQKVKFEFSTDQTFDKYKVIGEWYINEE